MPTKHALATLCLVFSALGLSAQQIQTLSIQVQTSNAAWAGTDNDVTLVLLTASAAGL